jgi:hypothetical protein
MGISDVTASGGCSTCSPTPSTPRNHLAVRQYRRRVVECASREPRAGNEPQRHERAEATSALVASAKTYLLKKLKTHQSSMNCVF